MGISRISKMTLENVEDAVPVFVFDPKPCLALEEFGGLEGGNAIYSANYHT